MVSPALTSSGAPTVVVPEVKVVAIEPVKLLPEPVAFSVSATLSPREVRTATCTVPLLPKSASCTVMLTLWPGLIEAGDVATVPSPPPVILILLEVIVELPPEAFRLSI